ncbi:MAG TPA: TlpA disulfide reductase family protein [Anaerolineales bacterium]|jgi:cytochrome c biogenesis protein CcmG/thiol:disulfide interchange protein DsbE|nr:TlpA disulfide reductase family protein [Anaerolineales bacterium]
MVENTNNAPRRGVPIWAQIIIWVLLVGLLVIIAFQLNHTQQGNVQPGQAIQDLSLSLYSGYELNQQTQFNLADYRGKVVVINFWASWCKPCEQEAAHMETAWQYYKDKDVIFIGVDYLDTESEARAYLEKFGITYPNGPDLGRKVSRLFRIQGVPETYFIDKNGVLQYTQTGPFLDQVDNQGKVVVDAQTQIKTIIDPLLK